MKTILCPYLMFNSEAREAMQFYQSILGGNLSIQTYGESGMSENPESKDRVIHACLENDILTIMASDEAQDPKVQFGDNVHLSIVGDDEESITKYWNGLAEGGKIDLALAKQFWGDTYGMLTDKFGVHWIVNISAKA